MVKNKILKRIVAGLSCIALSTTMLTSLPANKQFVIHFRLNAADWSNWDTSNDYSMGTEQLLPNDKIIVFYNEQLISGVQP